MKKVIFILVVSVALVFTACSKIQTDTYEAPSSFVADNDIAALQQLLTVYNTPIEWTESNFKATQATIILNWTLAAHANATTAPGDLDYQGSSNTFLSASSVAESVSHVYVGYHDYGSQFYGEILSVTKAAAATVSGAVHSNLVDVNDLEIDAPNNILYIAGESFKRGTEALKMTLNTGSGVLSNPLGIGMPVWGASGNSITVVGNRVWVSTGGTNSATMTGGLIILDPSPTNPVDPVILVTQDNGKHFDRDGDYGLWIQGNNSGRTNLYVFQHLTTSNDYYNASNVPYIAKNVTPYGKNAVDVHGTNGYVALGEDGVYKIDLSGATPGGVLSHYDDASNTGRANGLATDGTYVYVAHGADGLIVLDMNLIELARWNGNVSPGTSDDNGSCNYVAVGRESTTGSKVLYVAFGKGGLRKITFTP